MPTRDRDPIGKVCLLLAALFTERGGLTFEQAAVKMNVDLPRAREIVRQCAKELFWLEIDRSRRKHVLRLRGVGTTDATLEIAIAACLGASIATLFEGTRYHAGMLDALRFVIATSPSPERFVDLERRFLFLAGGGEAALRDRAELLDRVARAVLERHPISFHYEGREPDGSRDERVEPWALAIHKHRLYVIGRRRDRSTWVWRFARMSNVTTHKSRRFMYPTHDDFDPNSLFRESFGIWLQPERRAEDVEVALSSGWRAYARAHRWHASQADPTDRPDGRVSICLRVKICRELKEWILGFGRDAEVIRPRSLRQEIAAELSDAAQLYASPPSASPRPRAPRRHG